MNPLLELMDRSGAARSGELVAGSFPDYINYWTPYDEIKLWWAPLHTERMPGLTVRAILLKDPEKVRTVRYSNVATTIPEGAPFYPGVMRLPEAGTWRLIATAGPDWGCFELTLPG